MARTFTAIPSVVLIICLFLPALRVCGHPETPITFPPCYAAYVGAIGTLILACARRRWLLKLGAAVPPVLAVLTAGSIGALVLYNAWPLAFVVVAITLWTASAIIRAFVRALPSERALASIAITQGVGSAIWAAVLAFDRDGLWGAQLTLFAALVLALSGLAWLGEIEDDPPLPPAIVR
jgi:hypothetical protein